MLYEKYRPKKFKDVIGQGAISDMLRKQVETGNIAHTYLLEGNRGSGKTTSARILAKAINCQNPQNGEPCCECESCKAIEAGKCIDVVEIDAASNNGVDQIRDIISNMRYAPTQVKYKVYIIDEVHMLSKSAFNASLKLFEEPPKYGVFIMCTTEKSSLPITVVSRCQQYKFKHISPNDIYQNLEYISNCEGFNPPEKNIMLKLISKLADGAMRDAISLLEQSITTNINSYASLVNLLGLIGNDEIFNLINIILSKNSNLAFNCIYKVLENGIDIEKFTLSFLEVMHNIMLLKANASNDIIKMSNEDISKCKEIANNISIQFIMDSIETMQEAYEKIRVSKFKSVIFEMAVIKMIGFENILNSDSIGNENFNNNYNYNESDKENNFYQSESTSSEDINSSNEETNIINNPTCPNGNEDNIETKNPLNEDSNIDKQQDFHYIEESIDLYKKNLISALKSAKCKSNLLVKLAEAFERTAFIKTVEGNNIYLAAIGDDENLIETALASKKYGPIINSFFSDINGECYSLLIK